MQDEESGEAVLVHPEQLDIWTLESQQGTAISSVAPNGIFRVIKSLELLNECLVQAISAINFALLPASAIYIGSPNLDADASRRLFPFLTLLILQILTQLFA